MEIVGSSLRNFMIQHKCHRTLPLSFEVENFSRHLELGSKQQETVAPMIWIHLVKLLFKRTEPFHTLSVKYSCPQQLDNAMNKLFQTLCQKDCLHSIQTFVKVKRHLCGGSANFFTLHTNLCKFMRHLYGGSANLFTLLTNLCKLNRHLYGGPASLFTLHTSLCKI